MRIRKQFIMSPPIFKKKNWEYQFANSNPYPPPQEKIIVMLY